MCGPARNDKITPTPLVCALSPTILGNTEQVREFPPADMGHYRSSQSENRPIQTPPVSCTAAQKRLHLGRIELETSAWGNSLDIGRSRTPATLPVSDQWDRIEDDLLYGLLALHVKQQWNFSRVKCHKCSLSEPTTAFAICGLPPEKSTALPSGQLAPAFIAASCGLLGDLLAIACTPTPDMRT